MELVQVELGPRSYQIYIGRGARRQFSNSPLSKRRIVVITDTQVADLHLRTLLSELPPTPLVLKVKPGEESKSLRVAGELYDELAKAHIERHDLIITLGGGVVGDLGGFVAATWLRGIDFVQVPTTLEAAVDASVGGKTAVNQRAGKNLIGVFHQPMAVVVDLDFLASLPRRDYLAGLGESIKHAVIRDAEFFEWHEAHIDDIQARQPDVLAELIARNCRIKATIVSQDEREKGLRAILNYGHTIGHAIEHCCNYELRHGECVALGMRAVNDIACARGLLKRHTADRITDLIKNLGLPLCLPARIDTSVLVAACHMDKKAAGGAVNFVFATDLGQTARAADVTDAEIAAACTTLQP
ncbi:MAG: 3-dehydroquinate synthase [Planctomycetota bacterium]